MAPFSASSLCAADLPSPGAGEGRGRGPGRRLLASASSVCYCCRRLFTGFHELTPPSSRRRLAKTFRLLDTALPPAAFSRGSLSPAGTRTERALLETTQPPSHLWGPFRAHRTQGDLSIFKKK